jgi:hypothetical protein
MELFRMSVSGFLTFLAQALFFVSVIAILDYIIHRSPRRRDFALLCCALGIQLGLTLLKDLFVIQSGLLDLLYGSMRAANSDTKYQCSWTGYHSGFCHHVRFRIYTHAWLVPCMAM